MEPVPDQQPTSQQTPPRKPLKLSGEHDIDLDTKNRLIIPSAFRKKISESQYDASLVILIGRNRIPWMYPAEYYENELLAQRRANLVPGEDEEKFNEVFFGMTFPLEWDDTGRVVIPAKIIKRTNLSKSLTLVGMRDHIAVWDREAWERRALSHLDSWDEISERDREQSKQAS